MRLPAPLAPRLGKPCDGVVWPMCLAFARVRWADSAVGAGIVLSYADGNGRSVRAWIRFLGAMCAHAPMRQPCVSATIGCPRSPGRPRARARTSRSHWRRRSSSVVPSRGGLCGALDVEADRRRRRVGPCHCGAPRAKRVAASSALVEAAPRRRLCGSEPPSWPPGSHWRPRGISARRHPFRRREPPVWSPRPGGHWRCFGSGPT